MLIPTRTSRGFDFESSVQSRARARDFSFGHSSLWNSPARSLPISGWLGLNRRARRAARDGGASRALRPSVQVFVVALAGESSSQVRRGWIRVVSAAALARGVALFDLGGADERLAAEELGKEFFFEKKNQKTFIHLSRAVG